MSGRGLIPCTKCGELWVGTRPAAEMAKALGTVLRRAKAVGGDRELDYIHAHVGLATAELEGMCLSCGWTRVAEERGAPRPPALLSLVVVDVPEAEHEPIPAWMERKR